MATRPVSIGIHVPSVSVAGLESGEAYRRFFRAVEALGFDALWCEDRIFHPAHLADPLLLLGWAAAHTERVTLGTAVMVLNLRQAPVVARQISTLHHLSGGRVTLGVSVGGRPEEYKGLKVPLDKRVRLLRESVQVLRALLDGGAVDYSGQFFELEGVTVKPAARVPLLMGGVVEPALRRAGELADGWIMAPFGSLDDFARGWRLVLEAAGAAGKDPEAMIAGRLLYVTVDDDRARALHELKRFLHGYYGPSFDVEAHAIYGPPEEVARRLRQQLDAGITHLMLGVPSLDIEHLRLLASEILPALRS